MPEYGIVDLAADAVAERLELGRDMEGRDVGAEIDLGSERAQQQDLVGERFRLEVRFVPGDEVPAIWRAASALSRGP